MSRVIKRVLLILGISGGIMVILTLVMAGIMNFQTREMNPFETGEISPGIFAVKDRYANLFLVESNGVYLAIDAGMSEGAVKKGLDQLGIDPRKVTTVLLTHTDSDHIGGLGLFSRARIYLARSEEQMINGKTARALGVGFNHLKYPYNLLEDGQIIIHNGLKVRCLFTPGHTPGSVSYILGGDYLFSGDTMGIKDGVATSFNPFFNMDTPEQIKSLKKLAVLEGIKQIFTAHYGGTDDFQKAMAPFR